MEFFLQKIVKKLKAVHYLRKNLYLDVWQSSKYASELDSKVEDVSFLNQFEYQR